MCFTDPKYSLTKKGIDNLPAILNYRAVCSQRMWSEFEKLSKKLDDTGYNDTTDRISTIDGSLASVLSEQTESPV